jgi:sn-glycerol 3-phosphate transport system substrate-binding protein
VGACIKSAGFDTSPFIPSTLAQYAAGGVQWSLPFNVSDPVLLYNKKLFAAAGLDPNTPPVTLEDVAAMSKTLVDSGAAKYGIAIDSNFDNGGGWFLEQWLAKLGQFYTDNDNGRSARATKVTFNTPELAGVLTTLQTMVKDGTALDVGDNPSGADNLLAMADKDAPAAMTIATSASIGSVLTILKGGQFPHLTVDDVAVAPMPGPGSPGTLVGGASLWINDSGDPARVAAAWKYLEFMTAAQQQATWAATTGYVALRADATELEPLKTALADPRFTVAGKQLQDIPAVATSTGPVVGPLLEIRTAVAEGVAKILNGEDVTATLAEMESQANALITDYNERNPG